MFRTILPTALLLACAPGEEGPKPDDNGERRSESGDIVDIAQEGEDFSILASAISDAGLEGVLRGEGPYTVFAPTDEAFEALGVDLETLSEEQLTTILTYHVIEGTVVSDDIPDLADSVAELTLFFDTGDGVRVNDAEVIQADIEASNGVVHVVDKVLMPPDLLTAAGYAGLDELAGAVEAADPAVAETLSSPGPFTLFAPTDDAFEAASDITSDLERDQLSDVLSYHVLQRSVASDEIPAAADTLLRNDWGYPVTALFDTSDGVQVNEVAVETADIRTTNGVIHVIGEVLLPPTVVNLADYADLNKLLEAMAAASGDLGDTLSGPGPFTVFAPTNEAFSEISSVAADLSPDELRDVLLYHVVGGEQPVTSDALGGGDFQTLLGQPLELDADVVMPDIHGTNGVVHVIDGVLLPME